MSSGVSSEVSSLAYPLTLLPAYRPNRSRVNPQDSRECLTLGCPPDSSPRLLHGTPRVNSPSSSPIYPEDYLRVYPDDYCPGRPVSKRFPPTHARPSAAIPDPLAEMDKACGLPIDSHRAQVCR